MNDRQISPRDPEWTDGLQQLAPIEPPETLFLQGQPLEPRKKCIAVVGTRRCTVSGFEIAMEIGQALAEAGFVVVSGMALGIDTAAHRGALAAGGHTIAVLGCGLDVVFPERNANLQRQIGARGTLVTEQPFGMPPFARHFPARNRIIVGLSDAVIVVEGGFKSGAMITARLALDANRDVFAVPASPRNPVGRGPNHLIRMGEATPVANPKEIFDSLEEEVTWRETVRSPNIPTVESDELEVLHALGPDPVSPDQICRFIGRSSGAVARSLARLELRGLARRTSTGRYEITRSGVAVSLAST